MKPEKRFQKSFIRMCVSRDLQVIELSGLMNPGGKPDTIVLSERAYAYTELKVDTHKTPRGLENFEIKGWFKGRPLQLPYYVDFCKTELWRIFVVIKMNRGYEVLTMTRKLAMAILNGLKYKDLATRWFNNSNFFTNQTDVVNFLKERMRDES